MPEEVSAPRVASSAAAPDGRRWASVVLRCCGLLVMPLAAWLVLPPPVSITPPSRSRPQGLDEPGHGAPPPTVGSARALATTARPEAPAPAGVSGEVQDPAGAPVAHAAVRCTVGEREFEAFSDEAGHFRFDAEAEGCAAVAHKEHLGPSAAEVLRAGAKNQLRLTPPTGIAGNVIDESGAPVMTYLLAVDAFEPANGAKDGGATPPRQLEINDADGAFEWTELSAGRYALGVSVPLGPLSRSQLIDVTAGGMTRGVRLVTHPGVTVIGTITDAKTHAPIDGAQVFVLLGTLSTRIGIARHGAFKIEGAPAGPFDLHVFCFGYVEKILRAQRGPAGGGPLHVDVALRATQDDAPPPAGG